MVLLAFMRLSTRRGVFPSPLGVDGCFWHSCEQHRHVPKAHREWWTVKFASIVERDRRTDRELLAAGWLPVRVWEHEPVAAAVDRIEGLVVARR